MITNEPDNTYLDAYISDGQKSVLSLKNFYDTILISNSSKDHIIRVPYDDFFLKYRKELEGIVEVYAVPQALFYRPKMLSLELYGTTELWVSILRLNNMRNITEFHQPLINVYNADGLMELINIFFKREKKY